MYPITHLSAEMAVRTGAVRTGAVRRGAVRGRGTGAIRTGAVRTGAVRGRETRAVRAIPIHRARHCSGLQWPAAPGHC
jgi:hypothetical protein